MKRRRQVQTTEVIYRVPCGEHNTSLFLVQVIAGLEPAGRSGDVDVSAAEDSSDTLSLSL